MLLFVRKGLETLSTDEDLGPRRRTIICTPLYICPTYHPLLLSDIFNWLTVTESVNWEHQCILRAFDATLFLNSFSECNGCQDKPNDKNNGDFPTKHTRFVFLFMPAMMTPPNRLTTSKDDQQELSQARATWSALPCVCVRASVCWCWHLTACPGVCAAHFCYKTARLTVSRHKAAIALLS